jgi:hypothetical protein
MIPGPSRLINFCGAWLNQMLKGHLNYYAISGKSPSPSFPFGEVLPSNVSEEETPDHRHR